MCVTAPLAFSKAEPKPGFDFRHWSSMPMQSGGRLKPLSSFAREVILFVTGKAHLSGWENTEILLSWMAYPEAWSQEPLFRISHPDTRKQLMLAADATRFSVQTLLSNTTVVQYLQSQGSQSPAPDDKRLPAREQDLKRLLHAIGLFDGVLRGSALALIPEKGTAPWRSVTPTASDQDPAATAIREHFFKTVKAYFDSDPVAFENESRELKSSIESRVDGYGEKEARSISLEDFFNHLRPFQWAWLLLVVSALLWALSLLFSQTKGMAWFKKGAIVATIAGVSFQIVGFALRVLISGRPPVTNMYESVLWVGFGVLVFTAAVFYFHRERVVLAVGTAVAAVILFVADLSPAVLDPTIQPLVPVLRDNFWLTIHVLTITISYAAFALSLGFGNVALFQFFRKNTLPLKNATALNQLSYRSMQFGVVLLAAGTILGGVWADYSWGRFWGWDPKETWALIALLCYLAVLHARFVGWVGTFAFAALSVGCFLSVMMAWYGVNFVLGAGLHSYGFSTGGTPWVAGFCALELVWIAAARIRWKAVHS